MVDDQRPLLVIDDSALARRQVKEALASAGYGVVETDDGAAALEVLRRGEVRLVITDFMIPGMSGVELITSIRATPGCEDLPIVVLSTLGNGAVVEQAWPLGVEAWLKKPFKREILLSAIASLLRERERRAEACGS